MIGKLNSLIESDTQSFIKELSLEHSSDGENPSSNAKIQVFILANPNSGNRQGEMLVQNLDTQHFRLKSCPEAQIQVYNFLKPSEKKAGYNYIKYLLAPGLRKVPVEKIYIISAGGDGTFMSIFEDLLKVGIDVADQRLYFSVIPFGTGNDLSQVLGWGRFVPVSDIQNCNRQDTIERLVSQRLDQPIVKFDIWEITADCFAGGSVTCVGNKESSDRLCRKMSNYASLGLQGCVGVNFERNRHSSRVWNVLEYAKQSWRTVIKGVPPVFDYIKRIEHNGTTIIGQDDDQDTSHPNDVRLVEIIVQNIPGIWGRKVDLWGQAPNDGTIVAEPQGPTDPQTWTPQSAGDGKVEIYGIESVLDYFRKQMPWGRRSALRRLGQFDSTVSLLFRENSSANLMIDGEFYELRNCKSLQIKQSVQLKVVARGDPVKSRIVENRIESNS